MNEPKRHHFVPEMLLKRFCNSEGKMFCFDKRKMPKAVFYSSPDNLFNEGYLYSSLTATGKRNHSLEHRFSRLEGKVDHIIEKIVQSARQGHLPNLTKSEKALWDQYVYLQRKRVPDQIKQFAPRENFEASLSELIAEYEELGGSVSTEEKERLLSKESAEMIWKNAVVDTIANPGKRILEILAQRGICVAIIHNKRKSFIIGSNPIVKLNQPGRAYLGDPTVELWLPIAYDVMVSPALDAGTERVTEIDNPAHIREMNELITKQSTAIAGRSEQLIKSLARIR